MWVDFKALPDTARVWVFQSDKVLEADQVQRLQEALVSFLESWCAHAAPLRSGCEIRDRLFLVIGLDEGPQRATGCALDALFRALQGWERAWGLKLTNRLLTAYRQGDAIRIVSLQEFKKAVARGEITPDTPVFDTTVPDKKSFQTRFETPAAASWHKKYWALKAPSGSPS